jgi:antitoxin HigA-1
LNGLIYYIIALICTCREVLLAVLSDELKTLPLFCRFKKGSDMSDEKHTSLHPGMILRQRLQELGWSNRTLVKIIDRPEATVSKILNGEKSITPENAVRIGAAFGDDPEFWLKLQRSYDLSIALEKEQGVTERITRMGYLYRLVPNIDDADKRGWLPTTEVLEERLKNVHELLGILPGQSPDFSAYKGCGVSSQISSMNKVHIWWMRVLQVVRKHKEKLVFQYDDLEAVIRNILIPCARAPEGLEYFTNELHHRGIHLVIEPTSKDYSIDGAAFWDGEMAVVALTLRDDAFGTVWWSLLQLIWMLTKIEKDKVWLWDSLAPSNSHSDLEKQAAQLADKLHGISPIFEQFPEADQFDPKILPTLAFGREMHEELLAYRLQREWGDVELSKRKPISITKFLSSKIEK